ncbi:MAG: MFS transporter [Ktedonobacteraceae bacterium]
MSTTHPAASIEHAAPPRMNQRLMWIMAVACGLSVANLYYVQPILADMGRTFHISVNQIGAVTTCMQIGFALGLLLIVPLGDIYNKRTLIVSMLVAVSVALVAVALAPTLPFLIVASLLLGVTTVVPQMVVPFAAILADARDRGRVVGTVMSGLLIGVLLARTVSGFIGAHLGWRAVYWVGAGLMVVLALVLRLTLPSDRVQGKTLRYGRLLASLVELARAEPLLREVGLFGALAFGAFNVFWVTLAFFLETPPYHYSSEVAGLFGLVGVAGALAASVIGKLADRMEARVLTGIALLITLLSFVTMWFLGHWLWGLAPGVVLLDLGVQGAHVSNQTRIYRLPEHVRNRANTVYMVPYFIGGSLGSFLGTYSWSIAGWTGVCISGTLLMLAALGVYILNSRRRARVVASAS